MIIIWAASEYKSEMDSPHGMYSQFQSHNSYFNYFYFCIKASNYILPP